MQNNQRGHEKATITSLNCDPFWENWPLARIIETDIAALKVQQPAKVNIQVFIKIDS